MSPSNEYLLNNALTENFQNMLRPYYLPQKLLCVSKYRIKDNFVLPNSKACCAITLLVLCVTTYACFTVSLSIDCTIEKRCPLITGSIKLLGHFVMTACIIVQTEPHVRLLSQMQSIDRQLRSLGVQNIPYFVTKNWCSAISIFLFYGLECAIGFLSIAAVPWITYIAYFILIMFDLDMLHATCIVEFLSSRMECFSNFFIDYHKNPQNVCTRNNLKEIMKNLLKIPNDILKAFDTSKSLLQFTVLITLTATFTDSLMAVQTAIEWTKNPKDQYVKNIPVITVFMVVWVLKKIVFLIMFSVACERFYSQLDDTKSACTEILELYPEKCEQKSITKNVLRLCNANSDKMRVCCLFTVDATLPLRLMGLTTMYCIVLLQFAFL